MRTKQFRVLLSIFILLVFLGALPTPLPAQDSNTIKARALVDAAIKMTDSEKAVKLLWQATDIDPTLQEAYLYLGLYYQSKQDFNDLVKVYQKLVKYKPNDATGWINIGEAYMSFTPPKTKEALPYYRKGYELDPNSSWAALRIGEILAQQGDRTGAIRYLRQASADSKNPSAAAEAQKMLSQMGAS
ncbi:MAG TPA: tetratricopeptide repeat protein [Candidatus Binataceae bacterium]|nr:tetratricopeptide repeat protein [Candidatus Binataceae bacterium]